MKKHILGFMLFGLIVGLVIGTYKVLFFVNQMSDVEPFVEEENTKNKKVRENFATISQVTVYPERSKNNIEAEIVFDNESNRKNVAFYAGFCFLLVDEKGTQILGTENFKFLPKLKESETIVRRQTIASINAEWFKNLKPGENLYVILEKRPNDISETGENKPGLDLSAATPVLISKEK